MINGSTFSKLAMRRSTRQRISAKISVVDIEAHTAIEDPLARASYRLMLVALIAFDVYGCRNPRSIGGATPRGRGG